MNAKDLIGEVAIRTAPVTYENGHRDYSYCNGNGVKIIGATDTHVVIESPFGLKPYFLDSRWLKDWISVESILTRSHQ